MKYLIFIFINLFINFHCSAATGKNELTGYVNPFIGTGAVNGSSLSGNTYPGATVPFGMVQLSPDTRDEPDWSVASGYDYNDKSIVGFSHTHLSGTGAAELFDVLVMPTTGRIMTRAGSAKNPSTGYRSRFSHDQEKAHPGYYSVKLLDYNINAELTATSHAGFHRYTFSPDSSAHIVFDLNHSLEKSSWGCHIIDSQIRMVNAHTMQGYRVITGWAKLRKVYFYAEFSQPVKHVLMVNGDRKYDNPTVLNGSDLRAVLDFDVKKNPKLLVKIGLSAVSAQNARMNLQAEIPDWNFDQVVATADSIWENQLEKIKIQAPEQQMEIFYTALYHTLIQPNNLADVNGDFQASDYTVQNSPEKVHYSTFSLWDSYRAVNPLYTLIESKRVPGFVNSMISQYDTYGFLPVWQLWGEENYCMIGNHAIPVVVDAVLKGIQGIDPEKAYQAVKNSSLREHENSPFHIWEKYHYMPENLQSQSVSLTLEMAFDDWCVAQLAHKLGKMDDYHHFTEQSHYYRNLYDGKSGFFRAKDDKGNWIKPFNPLKYGANGGYPYTEGNAWQYLWYVPQDINGLIQLCGGEQSFTARLDTFFTLNVKPKDVNGNASGFIGQYAHGNEPSHHVAYLYDYAGQPWKTQFYVSKIMREMYNTRSSGYAGNEDCGQMSAWYVFSAMGFYPVNPDCQVYALGSPAVQKSVIHLSDGKTFTIKVKNYSPGNIYIRSARLNGKNYTHAYLRHQDIENGGELELTMSRKPNRRWGTGKADRPVNVLPADIFTRSEK